MPPLVLPSRTLYSSTRARCQGLNHLPVGSGIYSVWLVALSMIYTQPYPSHPFFPQSGGKGASCTC